MARREDLKRLESLFREGARMAFEQARQADAPGEVFGYALYSDDEARTIVCAVGRRVDGWPDLDDDELWNPHEWEDHTGLEHLDDAQQLLTTVASEFDAGEEEVDWTVEELVAWRHGVFDAGARALQELRESESWSDAMYVVFSVSQWDENDIAPWVEQLNAPPMVEAFRRWVRAQR